MSGLGRLRPLPTAPDARLRECALASSAWTVRPSRAKITSVLPSPMLARPDDLPRGDYAYEVKWDGFRAIIVRERGA